MSVVTIFILILIGLFSGFFSGFLGIGGGLIMIPLMLVFLGLTQHQAQGTALLAMLPPIGILAVINYYQQGVVKWEYALVIACAFVFGGYLGSKISLSMPDEIVRTIFGFVMLFASLKLIFFK